MSNETHISLIEALKEAGEKIDIPTSTEALVDPKEQVKENREAFKEKVELVHLYTRGAKKVPSIQVVLGKHLGLPYQLELPEFVDYLGLNTQQLMRVFRLEPNGNPNQRLVDSLRGFKKNGQQHFSDLLGKPVQYGWYDSWDSQPTSDVFNPSEKVDPRYRI